MSTTARIDKLVLRSSRTTRLHGMKCREHFRSVSYVLHFPSGRMFVCDSKAQAFALQNDEAAVIVLNDAATERLEGRAAST